MGFYERRIFPWLNDALTKNPELLRMREEALAQARGRVVEIGFGTGANLPYYPSAVDVVFGVEPNDGMARRAAQRIAASRVSVQVVGATAERLPFPAGSFDTAVSTLTLCSVSDPATALQELRRVLRRDGRLIVIEHGLAPEPGVAKWQNRLNRIENVLACGCNLNRPIAELLERAGFRFDTHRARFVPGIPRTHGWMTEGALSPEP